MRILLCAFHAKFAGAKAIRERVPDNAAAEQIWKGFENLICLEGIVSCQLLN